MSLSGTYVMHALHEKLIIMLLKLLNEYNCWEIEEAT